MEQIDEGKECNQSTGTEYFFLSFSHFASSFESQILFFLFAYGFLLLLFSLLEQK
jgi:hypothetical protein